MFKLEKLNFNLHDLEPVMDSNTLNFHYGKHHQAYCDNLNKVLAGTKYESVSDIVEILKMTKTESDSNLKNAIINNAGGFFNHNLFWHNLASISHDTAPSVDFLKVIERDFGSFEHLKSTLHEQALTQFGSGWAFLCVEANKDANKKLTIHQAPNQQNCYTMGMENCKPILALDVWEHAYYLQYQNRRTEFLTKLFDIINWKSVEALFDK